MPGGSHSTRKEKFKFGRMEVEYLGFIIIEYSVKPSPEFMQGIRDFPEPKDLSGARTASYPASTPN